MSEEPPLLYVIVVTVAVYGGLAFMAFVYAMWFYHLVAGFRRLYRLIGNRHRPPNPSP